MSSPALPRSFARIAAPIALTLGGLGLACAPQPVAPAPEVTPQPAAGPATPTASASAAVSPRAPTPAAAPEASAAGPASDSPPCIDGEVIMGTCLCSGGKGVDATGHCVFMPCPSSTSGGTVFRSESTGKCMECRPGTVRSGDGCVR